MNTKFPDTIDAFFRWVVTYPKLVIVIGISLILGFGSFLPHLEKDTSADAFLAADSPALVYKEKVRDIFGLSDPMVIALVSERSIFTPEGLKAIWQITDAMRDIENIDPDGITSLATESNIVGTYDGMEVNPFYEAEVESQEQATAVRDAIRVFPLLQGTLVANDETASLIATEMLDDSKAEETYHAILLSLSELNLPSEVSVHVAGEGV